MIETMHPSELSAIFLAWIGRCYRRCASAARWSALPRMGLVASHRTLLLPPFCPEATFHIDLPYHHTSRSVISLDIPSFSDFADPTIM